MELAGEPHVGQELEANLRRRYAGLGQGLPGLCLQLCPERPHALFVQPAQLAGVGTGELEAGRGDQEAQSQGDSAEARHDRAANREDAGHPGHVQRPGSTKGDQREAPRVLALLDHVHPGGRGHVLAGDPIHAPGCLPLRETEPGKAAQRPPCRLRLKRHGAAQEARRIEVAEGQTGVGDGGLGAAQPVAGGARLRPRALRPDLEQAKRRGRASELPPAPISIRSRTGTWIGSPLPGLKR